MNITDIVVRTAVDTTVISVLPNCHPEQRCIYFLFCLSDPLKRGLFHIEPVGVKVSLFGNCMAVMNNFCDTTVKM